MSKTSALSSLVALILLLSPSVLFAQEAGRSYDVVLAKWFFSSSEARFSFNPSAEPDDTATSSMVTKGEFTVTFGKDEAGDDSVTADPAVAEQTEGTIIGMWTTFEFPWFAYSFAYGENENSQFYFFGFTSEDYVFGRAYAFGETPIDNGRYFAWGRASSEPAEPEPADTEPADPKSADGGAESDGNSAIGN